MNRLVSVGYEGRRAEELIEMLLREKVATVVDVRLTPISRKPGMSKTKLSLALEEAGVRYEHLKELGNPRDNRALFRDCARAGRARFAEVLNSDAAGEALHRLRELAEQGTVALLCFERDHSTCHREMVADAVRVHDRRITVSHL
ncbi:DUF488 domain-containing protein [Nocardia sp. 2]|uniref:DUF488 domain-containing protein n=2 Tax=Nocardia acididurans TaxID=2802282 RepID=A0ABS1MGU0_9NOCA|nr:DUF488 domain-containing protein [Nocardia acididurans]